MVLNYKNQQQKQHQHCIRVNDFHIELIQKAMNSDCLLFPIKKATTITAPSEQERERKKEKMHRIGERSKCTHTRTHSHIQTDSDLMCRLVTTRKRSTKREDTRKRAKKNPTDKEIC